MEKIEIGPVVIDLDTLEVVDEFQRFLRPQINLPPMAQPSPVPQFLSRNMLELP